MEKQFQWINNDIDISGFYDKLQPAVHDMIKKAEIADKTDDEGLFLCMSEGIECWTKLLVPDVISMDEWDMICLKYMFPD